MTEGLVVSVEGDLFTVETASGPVRAAARGRLRRGGSRPLAGDRVSLAPADGGRTAFVIAAIAPRRNSLIRPPAANLDTLLIVASAAPPATTFRFIDALTVLAESRGIRPLLCVNKTDLDPGRELTAVYERVCPVFPVSARTGTGLDALRQALAGGVSLLAGNSGVGKSSLLNALDIGAEAEVGDLSARIGRGRQTTRSVRLHPLPGGGYLADSPGYSAFDAEEMELTDVPPEALPACFPEFRPFLGACRWKDCGHAGDEGCAVCAAAASGLVPPSRHASYVSLRADLLAALRNQYK